MTVWVVRAGRDGQREAFALDNSVVLIGWDELTDLSEFEWDDLRAEISNLYPEESSGTIGNWAGQAFAFVNEIENGDMVVLPLKGTPVIAVGRISGNYQYKPDNPAGAKHVRSVQWITVDLPRLSIDDDILASLGTFRTVYRVRAENAERRISAIVEGIDGQLEEQGQEEPLPTEIDLETQAKDQIRRFIDQKFRSHNFANLVSAILVAKGYTVELSSPGPDGGVDIVAGKGALGFGEPKIVVQVKSGSITADVNSVRELSGLIEEFGADRGLFVSWGGFSRTVLNESRQRFFKVRLWDSDDVLREIQENYDNLPDDIQARLPLKHILVLVPRDENYRWYYVIKMCSDACTDLCQESEEVE